MSEPISRVRLFAGFIKSEHPDFAGLFTPATLVLIERDRDYECRFVMFVCVALAISMTVAKDSSDEPQFSGTLMDPRGWEVICTAKLKGNQILGTFDQPNDHGTFLLDEV